MYRVVVRSRFERVFKKLDRRTQIFLMEAIEKLAQDPFHHPQVRAIVGVSQKAYRLRVGSWRVLYFVLTRGHSLEVIDLFIRSGDKDYRHI